MPQPKNAEAETAAVTPAADYRQADGVGPHTTGAIEEMLDVANSLDAEKKELQERIRTNRDMLRGYVTQRLTTPEQAAEIEQFYPTRTRRSKDNDE